MDIQSLMESVVILVFAFNTVATVALCIAVRNLHESRGVHWDRIIELCKATGVSYLGLWQGVRRDKIGKPKSKKVERKDRRLVKVA